MKIGQVIRDEFDNKKDLSGIGGVETGRDAAEFLLLGANSVQVSMTKPSFILCDGHSVHFIFLGLILPLLGSWLTCWCLFPRGVGLGGGGVR